MIYRIKTKSMSSAEFTVSVFLGQTTLSKHCRFRSDTTEHSIWSGSLLLATRTAIFQLKNRTVTWSCSDFRTRMVTKLRALTHCRLNRLFHTIYWKSSISVLGTTGYELDIRREKWLNYLQTVETMISRRIPRHLIWVCTVCQLPF